MSSFICSGCKGEFKVINTGVKDQLWCDECYNYKTCAKCNNPINRNMVTFKTFEGKDYHPECLKCSSCRSRIKKIPKSYEGKLYCDDCIQPCTTCGKPVGKSFSEIDDKKYHEDCLLCSICNKKINPDNVLLTEDGNLLCEACAE